MEYLLTKKITVKYVGERGAEKIKGIFTSFGDGFVGVAKGAHVTYIPIRRIIYIRNVVEVPYEKNKQRDTNIYSRKS